MFSIWLNNANQPMMTHAKSSRMAGVHIMITNRFSTAEEAINNLKTMSFNQLSQNLILSMDLWAKWQ